MKILGTTQYLTAEDAEVIIHFLDEIREMLLASYEDEIRQHHRIRLKLEEKERQDE